MKNISKKLSAILSLVLILVMIFSQNVFASNDAEISQASLTPHGQSRLSDSKYLVDEYTEGNSIYKVYRYHEDGFKIIEPATEYPAHKTTPTMDIQRTIKFTYSSETTLDFSLDLGMSASLEDLLDVVLDISGGRTSTETVSYSNGISVTYHLLDNDPQGYYKIDVIHEYERYYVEVYTGGPFPSSESGDVSPAYIPQRLIKSGDVYVPTGSAYIALLYCEESDGEYIIY